MKKQLFAVLTALLLVLGPAAGMSSAATVSNTVTVPLVLNIPESISLSLSTNSITLSNAQPSANVTLTAGWQILPNAHTSATIYAFFSAMPTLSGGGVVISQFTTQYNGGAVVDCSQGAFPGQGPIGVSGKNCGTFAFPNIASDTNDSQAVVLTVAVAPSVFSGSVPVGSYQGGVLNIVFQIV